MTPPDPTPIPRISPRKGFTWLPLPQQLSVFALIAALLLACLPLLIDTGQAGSGQLKSALRRPPSLAGAIARLERHVGLTWWSAGSTGEQRLRQKLLIVAGAIVLAGAAAGWKSQEPAAPTTTTPTAPRIYGTVSPIRASSALAWKEHDHG